MGITYSALTDVGQKRDHNEDAFMVDPKYDVYAVCDGMGGHAAGEVASAIAAQSIQEAISQNSEILDKYRSGDEDVERYEILQMLEHAIQTACDQIYEAAQADEAKKGMGTTCSTLMIIGNRGYIGHVGDSRVYLVRGGNVHQITEDHSLVNELVRRGKLKRDQVAGSPYNDYKNAVTRAVGVYPTVEGDTLDFDVLPGDQFLLCSDGLSHYLTDDNTAPPFEKEDLDEITQTFIDIANTGGGHDNITAVVVRVSEDAEGDVEERAAEVSLTIEVLQALPLFRYLSYTDLVHILNMTEIVEYAAGDVIYEEGSKAKHLHVVLTGEVQLKQGGAHIASQPAGTHFGQMALVDRAPRAYTAVAGEGTRVMTMGRKDFYGIIREESPMSVKLLWSFVQVLTERLRGITAELTEARQGDDVEDLDIEDLDMEELDE